MSNIHYKPLFTDLEIFEHIKSLAETNPMAIVSLIKKVDAQLSRSLLPFP